MTEQLQITLDGAVQIIRFNRIEKKNALTSAMYQGLVAALKEAAANDAIAVTVFLGQPGIFTAGNDIADFLSAGKEGGSPARHAFAFINALADAEKPLIAGVDGAAVGIGTTLLLHCDLAYASERSTFQTPFVNLGLVPEAASSLLAPRLMGYARAFELLVMGEVFTAEQAKEAGLINKIVAGDDVDILTIEAAKKLAKKPREAVRLSRQLIRSGQAAIKARIKEEADLFEKRLQSPEAAAAFEFFLSKSKG
jgi:enoyl-CoA hydratase/carnithine racemase